VGRALLAALGGFAVLSGAGGIALCEAALHPPRKGIGPERERQAADLAREAGAGLETVECAASDGVRLRAWFFRPANGNGDGALLLHGVAENRVGPAGLAGFLLHRGYAVLAPDARAHGESGGEIATYGIREAADVRGWVDCLVSRERPRCVFGYGASMGGAILLQALRVETRFCAVVAESPFASLREVTCDRVGFLFGTGPWLGRTVLRPTIAASLLWGRLRHGVDLDAASPEAAVAGTRVPILLVHGTADENIPIRHSRRLHAANPEWVDLWEVEGAAHTAAHGRAPSEFEAKVIAWFEGR
jgi:hypothetical protein